MLHLLPHLGISRVAHLPYIGVVRKEEERKGKRECESKREREKEKPPLDSSLRAGHGGRTVPVPFRLGESTPGFLARLWPVKRTRNAVYRGH